MDGARTGTGAIRIHETDLKGDCYRLNRRLDLLDYMVARFTEAAKITPELIAETQPEENSGVSQNFSVLSGTHAVRLQPDHAPSAYLDRIYWETDRMVLYVSRNVSGTPTWMYAGGSMSDTLANIPTDLGTEDAGFEFRDETYGHTFIWSGAAWGFAPSEILPGTLVFGEDSPGVGWHSCDGSTVTRCKRDGSATTESVTLPDATGCFLMHGVYSAVPVAASAPSISGETADESAHTHGDGTYATDAVTGGTPAGTVTVNATATGAVPIGTGAASAAAQAHSHTAGFAGSPLGTHSHDVTGSSGAGSAHKHTLGTLTVDSGGVPKHLVATMYMRL